MYVSGLWTMLITLVAIVSTLWAIAERRFYVKKEAEWEARIEAARAESTPLVVPTSTVPEWTVSYRNGRAKKSVVVRAKSKEEAIRIAIKTPGVRWDHVVNIERGNHSGGKR